MSRFDKLLKRFLSKPKDYSYNELKTLLGQFGYIEQTKGKTSGSRFIFYNDKLDSSIQIHKPHGNKPLKDYQIVVVRDELRKRNIL
ncbi:MAG: type II toxin-antitoxin system HicA family toxin [Spirochaetota bacterium]|nr:type II toxin-antitoxin system HicA family toxin [Spirochaetota bacterium]